MRPIDADALKETISKYEFNAPNERYKQGGECMLNFYMPKIIDDAPTIVAEPVKHGKWIKKRERAWFDNLYEVYYSCSCCNDIVYRMYNYCPNCGAKMDLGEEDES